MTPEWFAQYMHLVAANVKNKEGQVRFNYRTLKDALNAIEHDCEHLIPKDVLTLFSNIVKSCPPLELSERTQNVLFLALLNCHMAYLLASNYLLNGDDSIVDKE